MAVTDYMTGMMFWISALVILGAVALALMSGLRRGGSTLSGADSDLAVYRDQLKEVDRDLARGVLNEAEAELARTEVSRRLLEADTRATQAATGSTGQRAPLVVAILGALAAGSIWLYTTIGAPGANDLPMTKRLAALEEAAASRPSQAEAEGLAAASLPSAPEADPKFLELMVQLRAALKERPDDMQGLELLAGNEARLGNFVAAREAQEQLVALQGDAVQPDNLVMLIDLMVFSTGGYVSPEAESHIRRLTDVAPGNGAGQYYAGLLLAQNGRPDRAFPIWKRLLETSSPDAPWVPVVRAEIVGLAAAAGVDYQPPVLSGPTAADVAAAQDMTADERQDMIRGMVDGLAERLATEGGPPEEWARLITALGVLGDTDRATTIAEEARVVFGSDANALALIEGAAARLGGGQ